MKIDLAEIALNLVRIALHKCEVELRDQMHDVIISHPTSHTHATKLTSKAESLANYIRRVQRVRKILENNNG